MKYKVKTAANLTPEQLTTLQGHGCKLTPYIKREHEWIFAAFCNGLRVQAVRNLAYVTSVELMPSYSVAEEAPVWVNPPY